MHTCYWKITKHAFSLNIAPNWVHAAWRYILFILFIYLPRSSTGEPVERRICTETPKLMHAYNISLTHISVLNPSGFRCCYTSISQWFICTHLPSAWRRKSKNALAYFFYGVFLCETHAFYLFQHLPLQTDVFIPPYILQNTHHSDIASISFSLRLVFISRITLSLFW